VKQLGQFDEYLVHEFVEDYRDGHLSRRDMVRRVLYIVGSVAGTATVLTRLGVTPVVRGAEAQQATPAPSGPRSPISVPADDPRVVGEDITFPGSDGATIMAYQARPSGTAGSPTAGGALPVVLVCHENRGLTDHIRDVARRWAVEGYVACAVDLLSREGGTAAIADPSQIPSILSDQSKQAQEVDDFKSAADFYKTQDFADATRLGMNGFCFGGGITWRATEQITELKGAAPYYGPPPPLDQVANIKAAVLGVYSSDPNDFANKGRDELDAALTAAGVTHEFKAYPGTKHAFNNDTGQNYNQEQALAAWNDAVAWFAQYVKGM
jgi:carboxymethylenebutenolidase